MSWNSGLTTQNHLKYMNYTHYKNMSKSDIIKAKVKIMRNLNYDLKTRITLKELCYGFLLEYDKFKWICDDIKELVGFVKSLLETNDSDNLLIVIGILTNLERK